MKITVNNTQLELHDGAKVKDAIRKYFTETGRKVPVTLPEASDKYGNTVDQDGELNEGSMLFFLISKKGTKSIKLKSVLLFITILFAGSAGAKAVPVSQGDRQAVIFAVNDMHATIDNFPKLAFIVDSLRALYPDMLLVAAGDNQTGNPVNDQYPQKGEPVIELMNAVGFDLSAVGNHEFDSRPKGFSYLTHKAKFSFISANVTADDSLGILLNPYKIITLPNGLKLAFLGLLQINQNGTPDSHPDNTKPFAFRAPFETVPEFMYLKDQSDVFIALTHLGFETDVKLAETMPAGIDLIIGGHSHTRVAKEQFFNGILITQAENKLKYGSLIKLTVKNDGSIEKHMQLLDIRNSKSEKPELRVMVDKFNDNPFLNQVIATAAEEFSSYEELGYLMTDAQRDAAKADIALINPGGVRIDRLAKGPVTIKNVYQLDPFGNELTITRLTGKEIRDLMLAAWDIDDDAPLYPSGLATKIKLGADGNPSEITLLTAGGKKLDLNRSYTVAMNNYMTTVYKYKHADPGKSLFISTADATIAYLRKIKAIKSYKGEKRVQVD